MKSKISSKKMPAANPAEGTRQRTTSRSPLRVGIKQLEHADGLPLPAYQSPGAAGLDLVAAVAENTPVAIRPGDRALIPTGLVMEIPEGYEAQVRPRSGLALKFGVTVLNTPGTIDADYRGEIGVILYNSSAKTFRVARGDRIAQMVIAPVTRARLIAVDMVSATGRGRGGFGSTGASSPRQAPSPAPEKPNRPAKRAGVGKSSAKPAILANGPKAKAKSGKMPGKPAKTLRKAK